MSYKTHAHGNWESYNGVVPTKQSNEGRGGPKETVEGRPLTKENMEELNPRRTPSRERGPSGLDRVRQAAKREKKLRFTALLHHGNDDLLGSSYRSLKKRAAAGVDGVTWEEYGEGLEGRLADLQGRIHSGGIGRNRRGESGYRKPTEGNDRWGSRRWKTRSFSTR